MSASTEPEILTSAHPPTSSVRITIPTSSPSQLLDPSIVTPASDPEVYDYGIEEDESPEEAGDDNEDFENNICGDKEKVGRWSEQEHQVFLDGLNHFGKQWKTIAGMIGVSLSRTTRSMSLLGVL
jgi:SHAQKYF class myb-like DNA-binding protein